ncbi:MAG: lactonase family protein [Bacteroides sp.]|nr:lactonase family protein [Bacteroides sp.]
MKDNNHAPLTLLVGTYTSGASEGIYVYDFDSVTGTAVYRSETAVEDPSYLNVSADEKFVYSVSEGEGAAARINAFTYDKDKKELTLLNSEQATGNAPCYIIIDRKRNFVIVPNYSSQSLSVYPLAKDGTILPAAQTVVFEGSGPDKERQSKPHPHCAYFSPDSNYVFVPDLGSDCLHRFRINDNAKEDGTDYLLKEEPKAVKVAPGSGPRHITFHPNGKYAYLINELSGTVIAFYYEDGILEEIQTIPSDLMEGRGSADIHISPDGRYLYASHRLVNDGVAVFDISQEDGTLTPIEYVNTGIHPRNFTITPDGKFLLVACRDSDVVQIFARDEETGKLTDTGNKIALDKPVCLKWIGSSN